MLLGRKGLLEFGMALFMKVGAADWGFWDPLADPEDAGAEGGAPGTCPEGVPISGEGAEPGASIPPEAGPLNPGPLEEGTAPLGGWLGGTSAP